MPLAGCIGGEEVNSSEYEDQIAELEEMLEMQNQTIAQRDATIDGLQDGITDATQMIQNHEEEIAILESYRDSLLVQLENSNNSSSELVVLLESANASIESKQSQITVLETLRDNLSVMLNSSNATIETLLAGWNEANSTIPSIYPIANFYYIDGYPSTATIGTNAYFEAAGVYGTNGYELWKSDGTSNGTVMVKDINSGSDSSFLFDFTAVGNTLYFRANDGTNGTELWKSDGTASGTMMIKDISYGILSTNLYGLTVMNNSDIIIFVVDVYGSNNTVHFILYSFDLANSQAFTLV